MKTREAENLNKALKDEGVQFKHLNVVDYMKAIKLSKKLSTFTEEQTENVNILITEYNKEHNSKIRSQQYKDAVVKKESKKELTEEEELLLSSKPVIQVSQNGFISGPFDFIDKINKVRDVEFKTKDLNFIDDVATFKTVVENASAENQIILYEYLFKQ